MNIINSNVPTVLQIGQIGYSFKDERVRVRRTVGHVTFEPFSSCRVGRYPNFVHNFLPTGLVDKDISERCPWRGEYAVRSSGLPAALLLLGRQRGHQNAVDDERCARMARCGAVTFKRDHLDAQKPQLGRAHTLNVVLQEVKETDYVIFKKSRNTTGNLTENRKQWPRGVVGL